ncbi:isochorismate synthase [Flavobacterium longum]|uniref:isochorismate synthase n=1 Tax=Flavobacterium longum TaxID=1299340 RepID=UPI0039EB9CB6
MSVLDWIWEKADACLQLNKPFTMYATPGNNTVTAYFQRDANIHFAEDFTRSGFIFCSFDGNSRLLIPADASDVYSTAIVAESGVFEEILWPEPTEAKAPFESIVSKAVVEIQQGTFAKVVLSRRETVAISDGFQSNFTRMFAAYPNAFRYVWFHPETGMWMGATPERLIQIENRNFKTVALAGTQAFLGNESVQWAEKERAEQQFVTDFIIDGLQPHTADLKTSAPYTARAGNLWHIKTDIEGQLAPHAHLRDIVTVLHPTPAVCGYPKAEAMAFIAQHEGYDRKFYSGFLGTITPDSADLYVNLRCMELHEKTAHLYIGCGITKDSNPEKEFEETANKALTMKKILR